MLRWAAIAVLGALGFLAFLSFAAGARLDAATGGLVFGAGALVFSLATLFKMVQVLARPGRTLAPKARELAGADRSALREEKRRLLRAINELKFDFEMGKLSEADFNDVKQTYELRAVEVMRQLDGSRVVHPEVFALLEDRGLADVVPEDAQPQAASAETVSEDVAEADVAASDDESGAAASDESDDAAPKAEDSDDPEEGDAEADEDASKTDGETVTCGACGGKNDPDAKFCKHCGKEISE